MFWNYENTISFIFFISYLYYEVSEECTGPREVKQDFGARLTGHAFITSKNYGAKMQCVHECLARSGHCVSINFNQKEPQCELNNKTKSSVPLVNDPDFIYTDIAQYYFLIGKCATHTCPRDQKCVELRDGSPMCFRMNLHCDSNPCHNLGTCVQDGKTYTCECPVWSSGSHCEMLESQWISFGNSFYLIAEQMKTWQHAKVHCESLHVKLAEIETQEENNFIKNTLIKRNGNDSKISYWIGGKDLSLNGKYEWVSSRRQLNYSDWLPGEPSGVHSRRYFEHCIEIMFKGAWNNGICSWKRYFICEN